MSNMIFNYVATRGIDLSTASSSLVLATLMEKISTPSSNVLSNPWFNKITGWAQGAGVTIAINTASINTDIPVIALQQTNVLTAGVTYLVEYKTKNYFTGYVRTVLGTVVGTQNSGNGVFRELITADGTNFDIDIISDYIGDLDYVIVYPVYNLGVDGTELHNDANAASITNEANATTTFINAGCDTFQSQSGTVYNGTYAVEASANITPASLARIYKDIGTDESLVVGDTCQIDIAARHIGSGGTWAIYLSDANNAFTTYTRIANITVSDTTFEVFSLVFQYSLNYKYLVIKENNGTNDGGLFIDALSIKKSNEQVSNGDMSPENNNPGWSKTGTGTVSYVAGGYSGTAMQISPTSGAVSVSQDVAVTIGSAYRVSAWQKDSTGTDTRLYIGTGHGDGEYVREFSMSNVSWTEYTYDILAVDSVLNIKLINNDTGTDTLFDSVSVRLISEDKSNASNGMVVYGDVKQLSLSLESEYSGTTNYNLGNYQEQVYTSNLDFSTNGFAISFDIHATSYGAVRYIFMRQSAPSAQGFDFYIDTDGIGYFRITDDGYSTSDIVSTGGVGDGSKHSIECTREGSLLYLYKDEVLVSTTTIVNAIASLSNTSAVFRIGNSIVGTLPAVDAVISNVKVYNSALTKNNVKTKYRNQEVMQQRNAVYRVIGTSYELISTVSQFTKRSKEKNSVNTPIRGLDEIIHQRADDSLLINMNEKTQSEIIEIREFMEATKKGEVFTVFPEDIYSPVQEYSCRRIGAGYTESRNAKDNQFDVSMEAKII